MSDGIIIVAIAVVDILDELKYQHQMVLWFGCGFCMIIA
jgi:hypothetical protein